MPVFYSVVIQGTAEFCYTRWRFTWFGNRRIDEDHVIKGMLLFILRGVITCLIENPYLDRKHG
jgi:hypothetical protein